MEVVVTMDKFGRIMVPKKMRRQIKAHKFSAEVKDRKLVFKPIPTLVEAIGMFPEIDLDKFKRQHQEDKGKDD